MKQPTGKKKENEANSGIEIEVTQEEYDEQKKKGWDDDELLPPGKHVFRRVTPDRVARLGEIHASNTKVQITMKVDLDVLNHFKSRSQTPNAAPYQTQINSELRSIMERDLELKTIEINSRMDELLENDEFLTKLSKKLKEKELQPA